MAKTSVQHAVVIGSGFGGLGAAARLRAKGYKVTVLEGFGQVGGRAAVFRRDGFIFDAGPTVITAPYLLDELFAMLGRKSQDYFTLKPIDPFYRIVYSDGSQFDYVGDEERLLENIRKLSPGDVDGYLKLADHSRRIFDVGYTQLADRPFLKVADMIRVIPEMIRLENYRTVYSLVSKYIKDERLRQAFSFEPLLVGGNPFAITSIYLLIHWLERKWGVHFAMGGTNQIVQGLKMALEENDVEIHLNSPVVRLETQQGRVVRVHVADGRSFSADVVVSNADPVKVYGEMLKESERPRHSNRSLERKHQSMGLFVAYFGTKKTYPELAHHTILMGPRYKDLLGDIFDRKRLADDFSLYLHAPTRTDATMAPAGHECFYVLSPVPNNRSGINWSEVGEEYKSRIFNWLDRHHLPGLKENLVTEFFVTPDYFANSLRSTAGAGFGLEPRFTQSAYFRFHNRSEDLANLFFVGASTHPGAGVPGVLSSARALEQLIPMAQNPLAINAKYGVRNIDGVIANP